MGTSTSGLEQRVPCPCQRQSGCSNSRHMVLKLPLPFHGIGRTGHCSVATTAGELRGLSLTVPSGSARPWERQEGSFTLHVCVCVQCTRSQLWTRVCAFHALPLGIAPAVRPGLARSIFPVAQRRLCPCPCWVPHSWMFPGYPIDEVWLVAVPYGRTHCLPCGSLVSGQTRGYDTRPPLGVVFCHVKPQHLPGRSPPLNLWDHARPCICRGVVSA